MDDGGLLELVARVCEQHALNFTLAESNRDKSDASVVSPWARREDIEYMAAVIPGYDCSTAGSL